MLFGKRLDLNWLGSIGWKVIVILSLAALIACGAGENQDGVLRATLSNGLRVVIIKDPIAPVATTMVNYLVGSNEAPEGFPGMAHAQEHMMFRGSPGLSAGQLAAISAAMGGEFEADTQQVVTQYAFTVPVEDLDVALQIDAIRMRGVLDSDELWNQERGAIEQEVAQDLSNPEYVFYIKLLATMFKGTPYALDALGTRASFDLTTGAMLKKFYDTWYAPNNAILVITGDVDPQKTLASVTKLFGDIPRKNLPPRPEVRLQPVAAEKFEMNTDLHYGLTVVAFRFPGYTSPDYAASQVLADVLASQRGDLYALTAAGQALSTDFALSTLPEAGLAFAEAAFPKGGDPQQLLQEVQEVLAKNAKQGISADLVEAAKNLELAQLEEQKNSVSGLAMTWSEALAVEGRQSPADDLRAITKVTVEDVNRVARQYLDLDHAVVAILTPQASGQPISAKGFGGTESFNLRPGKNVTLPEWAKSSLERLAIPTSTVHPVVSILPNGIKLMVQPASISNTISVYGHIKNQPDLQESQGQEGIAQVLDQLFSYGTTSLDRLAFQKALDDIAAQVSAGTSFSLQVLSDHFERGVQLLADNELHPALPEDAFKIVRTQVAGTVAGKLQSPDYLANRAFKAALYPKNDPTLRQATPDTVSALTWANVKDYFSQVFRPDQTIIVVIGKVTPKQARQVIEQYFGQWTASGPKPNILLPPVPPNTPASVAVPDASRVQDKVDLGETLGLMTRSNPDYYALVLGNHVLGGGFYATRLYRELREETGLVYSVEVELQAHQTRALYAIEYACDPDNVAKVHGIVARNLLEMQSQRVNPDELRQAKLMLLRRIPLSESSLQNIAMGLLRRSILDLPPDEPITAAKDYASMTAEQVQAAFAKWVRPADLVQITQGPPPK
ncbi:MAG: M16 family metallopeptidase [Desulfobaccales bacterium]